MRKRLSAIFAMAFIIPCLAFGVSLRTNDSAPNAFDSLPMLESYYDEGMESGDEDYWSSCSISLVTIGEGAPLYSWFGHTALLVELPDSRSYMFDYGTFSFDAENFYSNFIMGRLWFCCNVSYADYELSYLSTTGRKVSMVELDFTPEQKKAIVSFLSINSESQNRTYLYHHYNDNCATRVRDIIDYATGGDLEAWAKAQPGLSFRDRASGALSKNRFIQWALEFLQSGRIDSNATVWDEMFLPELLEKYVLEYGLETGLVHQDGYTLVQPETLEGAGGGGSEPNPNYAFSIAMGVVLAAVSAVLLLGSRRCHALGVAYKAFSFVVDLVFGILGSVLLFMMLFTNHDVSWCNENILFVNPALLAMAVMSLRFKAKDRFRSPKLAIWYKVFLSIVAVLVVLKVCLPGAFIQRNWTAIIAMAPYYAANAFLLGGKGR